MRTIPKNIFIGAVVIILIGFTSVMLIAYPGGIIGRTLKTSSSGCSCHNSAFDPQVVGSITGPDSVVKGQSATFTLTITKASKTGAGLDIAARLGTLAPVSANIHLQSGELTHNDNIPMSGGTVSVQFTYTAPVVTGPIHFGQLALLPTATAVPAVTTGTGLPQSE